MGEGLLEGLRFNGLVGVAKAESRGLIEVRTALDQHLSETLCALGLGCPALRQIQTFKAGQVAWMSPDALLVRCDPNETKRLRNALDEALSDRHSLVLEMTQSYGSIRLIGQRAGEVLAKLMPLDLLDGGLEPGEFRRSRLAQISVGVWFDDVGATVLCPRSLAHYTFDMIKGASQPGFEIGQGLV